MTTISRTELVAAAERWIAGDPDPVTRAELRALIDAGDFEELEERMAGSLEFGTAGLRGKVEAGSNRMNRAVVIRTTKGLADWLHDTVPQRPSLVVVGHDARLSSRTFMEDTVGVLAAAGHRVVYVDGPTPTPLIAYLARQSQADAAVVITASHNPPADNGYKVYASNAVQIVPPTDREIAEAIARVGPAGEVPRADNPLNVDGVSEVDEDFFARYLADLAAIRPDLDRQEDLTIVYTPLHGVGGRFVMAALARFGYRQVHPVEEQFAPDGRFPTVAFPNPEEPGALDLATEEADRRDADLIIANDPDTDRLAVSLRRPDGAWRPLTGNQIGVLLADYVLEHTKEPTPIVINSIVSSPMLADIAAAHGARFATTLTGFKWIWNAALDLEAAGEGRFVFGYEEALGYSVGRAVRDKDGISAAVFFADLAAAARAQNLTVLDQLEGLYRRHGLWISTQRSIVRPGTEGLEEIAAAMRVLEDRTPETLAGWAVRAVSDYRHGAESRPRYLPAASLVAFDLERNGRVLIRPSGTEPKLKIYVDLRADAGDEVWRQEVSLIEEAGEIAADLARFVGLT